MRKVAHWAAHDLTRVHQISRVMAHQYRQAVGPFCAYLGVLHCSGHSSPYDLQSDGFQSENGEPATSSSSVWLERLSLSVAVGS